MKVVLALLLAALGCALATHAAEDRSCLAQSCGPGDGALTYASRTEPFHACPSAALAQYIAAVDQIVSLSIAVTGKPPNISVQTGEPEYPDDTGGPNKTRIALENFRHAAMVDSYNQAVDRCVAGTTMRSVRILTTPEKMSVVEVQDEESKAKYWLPKASLDKR